MNDHYHKNRDKEIEDRMLNGVEMKKPKFTKGEKLFFVALAFIVVSLIILL